MIRGDFGVATAAAKGSRGSDPRLLGLTMGRLLDRTFGGDPVHHGSSMPYSHPIVNSGPGCFSNSLIERVFFKKGLASEQATGFCR
jgi:hypothetical protein